MGVIGREPQETEPYLSLMVCGHKGSFALAPQKQVLGSEFVDRLAHCALADLEAGGQFKFTGNSLARLPFATVKPLQQQTFNLLIQWAECRTAGTAFGIGRTFNEWLIGHVS